MTTTQKRKVGRPRKDQPAISPYIELEEVDLILNSLTLAINSAKETRDGVYELSDLVMKQQAEPGSAAAFMLAQNRGEVSFAKIHADGVVDTLVYMKSRFNNMRKLFMMEEEIRKIAEKEYLKICKKN